MRGGIAQDNKDLDKAIFYFKIAYEKNPEAFTPRRFCARASSATAPCSAAVCPPAAAWRSYGFRLLGPRGDPVSARPTAGSQVYVATRGEKHRQLARDGRRLGGPAPGKRLPAQVDTAIIFAPAGDLVPPATAPSSSTVALCALAGIHMTPIPGDGLRPLHVLRARYSLSDRHADGQAPCWPKPPKSPIRPHTTLYPLEDANRALQDLKADRINGTGVLVMGGGG